MAGPENKWIKFEKALAVGDPKVLRIASRLRNAGVTPESLYTLAALGALTRLWSFADTHIRDDNTLGSAVNEVNEVVGIANFCDFLPAEWLQILDSNNIHLPDFLEHNGIKAKNRALSARRQQRFRERHNGSVTAKSRKSNGEVTLTELPKTIDHKTVEEDKKKKNVEKENRATRLALDWSPSAELKTFASDLGLDPARIAADFSDYWHAIPGARGVKLDWPATWRRWCRKALDTEPTPRPNGHAPGAQRDVAAWSEARALAKAVGFREPWPQESVGAYYTATKLVRDRPPAMTLAQLQARAHR
jgi:hypothetical protein